MKKTYVISLLAVVLAGPVAAQEVPPPPPLAPAAPMRITRGAVLFIEPTEFGMALSAALLKKKVPILSTTERGRASFFVQTISNATKEGGAERVTKLLLFGGMAGSGKGFNATVTIVNSDGSIVFAHNSKKENFQSSAENIAKEIKKHVEGRS